MPIALLGKQTVNISGLGTGTIEDVDTGSGELMVSFDGRSVTYGFGELDMLVLAYAATIHKSQGSEYPAVVIPVLTQHYPCCSGTFSTLASRAAKNWSCWSAKRRRLPLRCATSRGGDVGRSWPNGSQQKRINCQKRAQSYPMDLYLIGNVPKWRAVPAI